MIVNQDKCEKCGSQCELNVNLKVHTGNAHDPRKSGCDCERTHLGRRRFLDIISDDIGKFDKGTHLVWFKDRDCELLKDFERGD